MSLSDIMGNMDLSVYPQIGLVIFLAVFAGVVIRIFSKRHAHEWKQHASLPISEPARVTTETMHALEGSAER
ncbi:MAG: hypothetical protein KF902_07615 [Phycisphaeraceae bacterium]|nr:hypothetical protein [Phycisphaeraceae bacterium]